MKKIYFKIISIVIIAFSLSACSDFLDVVPDDSPTVGIVFENRVSAEKYLATCYRYLPNMSEFSDPGKLGGDELWINELANKKTFHPVGFDIAKGLMSSNTSFLNAYGQNYQGIRECNTFLENISMPYDMTEKEKQTWAAEVKFLKAFYHFQLMRRFGAIVIVKENEDVGVDIEQLLKERSPVDEVVDYCVELIDEAIPNLSHLGNGGSIEEGKIHKTVAYAIKAKILTLAASPIFNGNEYYSELTDSKGKALFNATYDPEKWIRAKEACKEAVEYAESEGFKLYEFERTSISKKTLSERTKLKYTIIGSVTESEENLEKIWGNTRSFLGQANYMLKANDPLSLISQFAQVSAHQYMSPPLRIAEMFYSKNGVPIEQDKTYEYASRFNIKFTDIEDSEDIVYAYKSIELHCNREPRFYASLGFDGAKYLGYGRYSEDAPFIAQMRGGRAGGYKGDPKRVEYSATGYLVRKLINVESQHYEGGDGFNTVHYSFPMIRLADLFLMYAEVINEVDGPTAECLEYVDRVRTRAGLNGVKESWDNYAYSGWVSDKDVVRKVIHQERMIELAFEGHRFWDLRRWKRSAEFMNNQPIMGWNIISGITENYYVRKKVSEQKFLEKDYLWPIPLGVILSNPNIKQNTGW